MKKYLALFLALLTLALSGAGAAAYSVASEQNTVTLSLTTLAGDPGALQGLTLSTHTNMDTCFWRSHWALEGDGEGLPSDTSLTIDQTRDLYYYADIVYDGSSPSGVEYVSNGAMRDEDLGTYRNAVPRFKFHSWLHYGADSELSEELPAYLCDHFDHMEEIGRMEEGETISIPLAPYESHYSYYITFSGVGASGDIHNAIDSITDRLKIPMLEEEHLLLTAELRLPGTEYAYTALRKSHDPAYDYFPMHDFAAVTEDTLYFTFDDRSARGKTMDTSQIDLGYGIYSVPIRMGMSDPNYFSDPHPILEEFQIDQLNNAYPFPAGTHCLHFQEGTAGHTLHLFTYEEGVGTFFNVLDTETLDTRYRLRLGGELTGRWALHSDPDGELVLLEFNQEIILLTLREDGAYDLALRAPRSDELSLEDTPFDLAYNGEKLALCTKEGGLRVYGPGQLLYSGSWTNSLLDHSACSLTRYRPVALTWGE